VSELARNTITNLTRRKVLTALQSISWSGDLEEVEFLERLYNLKAMPSTDSRYDDAAGDIWQHRVNNFDWDDMWVFSDERFGLRGGHDSAFVKFLAEIVHPEVRGDADEATRIVRELNAHLSRDGWELAPVGELSGYPIYGPRRRSRSTPTAPDSFPFEADALVASVAEVLKVKGSARELAVLANSQLRVADPSYDNWNGGTQGWTLNCALPASLYARLTVDDRTECEKGLADAVAELFSSVLE
jgi:hypothetical protein